MLEKLLGKAEAWVNYWAYSVLGPTAVRTPDNEISGFEFFLANQILAYALATFVWIGWFSYVGIAQTHKADMIDGLGILTGLFIAYFLITSVALLVSAILSFIVYRAFGGYAKFEEHILIYFRLSALDPLAGCAIAVFWINDGFQGGELVSWSAILAVMLIRLWQLVRGYRLLADAHQLTDGASNLPYAAGFAPSILIFNVMMFSIAWIIAADGIVPWWD